MHTTFCELNRGQKDTVHTKEEKAHLHDGVGDVIHIHSDNTKWTDLFDSIGYRFPAGKAVVGYKNGKEIEDILNQVVIPDESIIIAAGDAKDVDLKKYVLLSRIQDVESKTEYCDKN